MECTLPFLLSLRLQYTSGATHSQSPEGQTLREGCFHPPSLLKKHVQQTFLGSTIIDIMIILTLIDLANHIVKMHFS